VPGGGFVRFTMTNNPESELPKTLLTAVEYFASAKVCFEAMLAVKWPDGKITCPKCKGDKIGVITSRSMLQCKAKDCRKQFSVKVDTIFEDSPLPLQKWFVAIWCVANAKNGISSMELARALGVRQPTAWFMLHRVRLAMQTKSFRKLEGEVEIDETFIGGKRKNMHKGKREGLTGRGAVGKAIVQGLLERGDASSGKASEARMTVLPDVDDETLLRAVRQNVKPGAQIYSDAFPAYRSICFTHFHSFVDHVSKYVSGRVHTNGLENFFSLFKRCLKGTWVQVAPFHLQRYLDEQTFRFNNRRASDLTRFQRVLSCVVGRRITYRVLTATGDAGFMGIT